MDELSSALFRAVRLVVDTSSPQRVDADQVVEFFRSRVRLTSPLFSLKPDRTIAWPAMPQLQTVPTQFRDCRGVSPED